MSEGTDPLGGFTCDQLIGFDSLVPERRRRRPFRAALLLPLRLVVMPFKITKAVLLLPLRPFRTRQPAAD